MIIAVPASFLHQMMKGVPIIRRPAGVSCGSCYILLVLSCTVCFVFVLSRLSPWRNPPLPLIFPYVVVGSTLPTPRSTPAWFCTFCCHFDHRWLCPFLLCLPSVCPVPSYIQYLIQSTGFVCRTPSTRITFLGMYSLFQSRSQYGLFQNPDLHTCFGLIFNRGLNKTNVFASKHFFTQRAVLHENCAIHKHHVLHKNHFLAGPVQGLFAAYRIGLSMVAGGRRRSLLNITTSQKHVRMDVCHLFGQNLWKTLVGPASAKDIWMTLVSYVGTLRIKCFSRQKDNAILRM